MASPYAEKHPVTHDNHGIPRVDEYAWLKNKTDPSVIEHLNAENQHCVEVLSHTKDLRKELYQEMLGRIVEDDVSAPIRVGKWIRYTRTLAGKAYQVYCRRRADGTSKEEIVLDENRRAEGHEYYHVDSFAYSPSQTRVAWLEDLDGGERFRLWVKDLDTGRLDSEEVLGLKWSIAWGDDDTIFYIRGDHAQRPHQIWRRKIFSSHSEDRLVWEEPDERFFLSLSRSRCGQFVKMDAWSKLTTECRLLPTANLLSEPFSLLGREHKVEYSVSSGSTPDKKEYFVSSNKEAPNFQVFRVQEGKEPEVIIPHDPAILITGIDAFSDFLVVWYRRNGLPGLKFWERNTGKSHDLDFPDAAFELSKNTNPNYSASGFRFRYSSPITPGTIFKTDFHTLKRKTLKVTPINGGHNPEDYICERLWSTSRDGVRVPITLARKRGLGSDPKPLLLYGYGSYGYSYPVSFRPNWLSLMDRGVVVAIAHIRGGSEMGRSWYEDGKFFKKKNTFTDFIDAGLTLIDEGRTSHEQLVITGGSAGGLLMGAVLNMRPDLAKACVSRVPFVDVINTMLDPNLPLTVIEYEEWGNPNELEPFEYMLSYSPYDNIRSQDYPSVMVTAGLNDPRVGYWEPAKWVARLRELKTDGNPLILRTNMGAGHGGASGRYGHLEDSSWIFAFVLDQLGLS